MRLAALLLLTAVVSCGGQPAEPEQRLAQEPDAAVAAPLLQLTSRCYGLCVHVDPLGLPEVVVYDDGTVVRAEHAPPDPRARLGTGTVDGDRLDRLVELARGARLTGGERELLTYPHGPFFADGGGEVLTARIDGETTTVESPQPHDASLDGASSDPERRRALRELATALRGLEAPTPYDGSAVALVAEPAGDSARPPQDWDGPPLADLPPAGEDELAAAPTGDARCEVLEGDPAEQVLRQVSADAFPGTYRDGKALWTVQARPALPHEGSCADVAATVRRASAGATLSG